MQYLDIYKKIAEEARVNRKVYIPSASTKLKLANRVRRKIEIKNAVQYSELISEEGEDFVRNVYKRILLREMDDYGKQYFVKEFLRNRLTKDDVIINLRYSEEGKNQNVTILNISAHEFHLSSLMPYSDVDFLEMAYLWLLGRYADSAGLQHSLNMIKTGCLTKVEVAYRINHSPEGKIKKVHVLGLSLRNWQDKFNRHLFRMPVVGSLVKTIYSWVFINRELRELGQRIDLNQKQANNEAENLTRNLNDFGMVINQNSSDIVETNEIIKKQGDIITKQNKEIENLRQEIRRLYQTQQDIHSKIERQKERLIESDEKVVLLTSELCTVKASITSSTYQMHSESIPNDVINAEMGVSSNPYYSIDYFDFENHFRGSRDQIKNAQRIYIPYFENRDSVVDIGCGRGEFTELLLESGIGVTGVDMYAPYVEYMKMLKLPAILDDGIHYLKEQDEVDGVFLGQVVEHMTIEQVIELCHVAYEKLKPGNYLIMETPNPMSLAIFTHAFYMDPSHNKPVHPLTLQYICQKAGFSEVDILFTEGSRMPLSIPELPNEDGSIAEFNRAMKNVSDELYGSQDYAVIAKK